MRKFAWLLMVWILSVAGWAVEPCGQTDLTKPCMAWDRPAKVMVTALLASTAGDYASTRYALSRGGREANPLAAMLVKHEPAFIALKFGTGALAGYAVYRAMRDQRRSTRIAGLVVGVALTGLYAWATIHNVGVARRLEVRQR